MADILFDSSSLISLTRSCFINMLPFLKTSSDARFFITPEVEKEIVQKPLSLKTKEYSLSALRIKELLSRKTISVIDADIGEKAKNILNIANNIFFAKGNPLTIVHFAEIEIIATAQKLNIDNIVIDERTTRFITESPVSYVKHLELELGVSIMINKKNLSAFHEITSNFKFIRSSELLILAYELGYFDSVKSLKKDFLEAGLYSLRYSGCSISFGEIEKFIKKVN